VTVLVQRLAGFKRTFAEQRGRRMVASGLGGLPALKNFDKLV
jgi:hypothetical protein